ncbi:MAG: VWA domain-containing protein [Chloroflexales bacterium]|nr:VWA domain-containing protein [Chloroflexales bacterium]
MTESVSLNCTWSRMPLLVSNAPQVNYLLLEAQPVAESSPPVPLNFCLVLDRSGSMKGSKLINMKDATRRVIEMLTPQDAVSLVVFDDTVQVVFPAMLAADKAALLAQVDTIEEMGGTAMSLGLQAGQTELQRYLGPDRVSHMLVLTDGQTWGDEETCLAIAKSLGDMGVSITALGLGAEWNETLLDDLANSTGGSSDYIADPANIGKFFQRTLQQAHGTIAQEARLLLRLVRDATPRSVHRAMPTIANLGYQPIGDNEVAVKLGDLAYGAVNSVLIDLMLPARASGSFRIAQAELHFLPVGQTEQRVIKQDILLEFTTDPKVAAYDPRIMNLVEKVTAFKLQTRALTEAEAGNVSGATQKLRAAATRLLDLGELELASKTQQQAENLEQGTELSAETQKEIRYATRRLTQKLEE